MATSPKRIFGLWGAALTMNYGTYPSSPPSGYLPAGTLGRRIIRGLRPFTKELP
jgi:hypothetical protein